MMTPIAKIAPERAVETLKLLDEVYCTLLLKTDSFDYYGTSIAYLLGTLSREGTYEMFEPLDPEEHCFMQLLIEVFPHDHRLWKSVVVQPEIDFAS